MSKVSKLFYSCSIIAIIVTAINTANAATTSRPTSANAAAANRTQNRTPSTSVRMPTAVQTVQAQTTVAEVTEYDTEPDVVEIAEPDPEPVIIVDNKTSMFNDIFADLGANSTDSSSSEFADMINKQRALLDASGTKTAQTSSGITTANACDKGLRDCMTEKCGTNFTKCAKDSTTVWGNKMDSCRRKTKCTGHEYTLLAPEILADRDAYIKLSYYQSVVDCGYKYNECIFDICGTTLDKCLSKSAGDSAIAKCNSIARECKEQDSGLAGRVMGIFGDLRTIATAQVQKDEKRLYEIRDLMRAQCNRFGAMFDERTLDCVYTVNFFAGADTEHPMASKKLYSGDSFQCNANWFGIDVTTYKENAYRLTRSQKGASAAALGAGVGTAAGLLTSGAIGRALDTQKADKAAEEACIADGGEWVGNSFSGKHCEKKNGGTGNNDEQNGNDKYSNLPSHVQTLYNALDESGITDLANQATKCLGYGKDECTPENGCQWDEEKGCLALQNNNKGLTLACEGRPQDKCNGDECEWTDSGCANKKETNSNNSNKNMIQPFCGKITLNNQEPVELASIECTKDGKKYNPAPKDPGAQDDIPPSYTDKSGEFCFTTEVPGDTECRIKYKTCPESNVTVKKLSAKTPYVLSCSNNKNNTSTVNISVVVIADGTDVHPTATIKCGTKSANTSTKNGYKITLNKVSPDEKCTISASYCAGNTVTAKELSEKTEVKIPCKEISDCIKDNKTWMNGQCVMDCTKITQQRDCPTSTCLWTDAAGCVDKNTESVSSTVDLSFTVYNNSKQNQIKIPSTLECKYVNSRGKTKTDKFNSRNVPTLTLRNVPHNATCTITPQSPYQCDKQTKTARDLSGQEKINLTCKTIDSCINNGGTWSNNKCNTSLQDDPSKCSDYSVAECNLHLNVCKLSDPRRGPCVAKTTTTSRNANSNNNANNNTNIENLTFLGGCYKYLDDSTQIIPVPISNGDKYTSECNNVNRGDWVVTFSNNIKVTGTSICQKGTQTQDTCYCKGNSSQEWINMKQIDHDKCYGGCPYSCIELMQSNKNNFRKRITNQ